VGLLASSGRPLSQIAQEWGWRRSRHALADFRKEFGYKKSRDLIQPDLFSPTTVTAQEFVKHFR
jgi:AraC-like DNA-binding protein